MQQSNIQTGRGSGSQTDSQGVRQADRHIKKQNANTDTHIQPDRQSYRTGRQE